LICDYFDYNETNRNVEFNNIKISDIKDFEIVEFDEEWEETLKYYREKFESWERKYKIKNLLK